MGNLTLDKTNYQAFRSGKPLELNPQEFVVLWLLASRPDRAFSKQDILEGIQLEFPGFSDYSLLRYIRRLRQQLGEKYIRLVRGMGYQMNFC